MRSDPPDCDLPIMTQEEADICFAAMIAEFARLEAEWEQQQIKVAAHIPEPDASGQILMSSNQNESGGSIHGNT